MTEPEHSAEYVRSQHSGRLHIVNQESPHAMALCGRRIGIGERTRDNYDVLSSNICGVCHAYLVTKLERLIDGCPPINEGG